MLTYESVVYDAIVAHRLVVDIAIEICASFALADAHGVVSAVLNRGQTKTTGGA